MEKQAWRTKLLHVWRNSERTHTAAQPWERVQVQTAEQGSNYLCPFKRNETKVVKLRGREGRRERGRQQAGKSESESERIDFEKMVEFSFNTIRQKEGTKFRVRFITAPP